MKEKNINPTHSFNIEDVEKYGSIEKALLIKEIRSLQIYKLRNKGQGWVYYSASALADKFPYMKKESIKRWLNELIENNYLERKVRNKVRFDKTWSYRLTELSPVGQNEPSIVQNELSEGSKTHHEKVQNEPTIPPLSSLSSLCDDLAKDAPVVTSTNKEKPGNGYLKAKAMRDKLYACTLKPRY